MRRFGREEVPLRLAVSTSSDESSSESSSDSLSTWSVIRCNPIQMYGVLCGAAISKSIIKSIQLNLSIVTILWVVGGGVIIGD